MLRRLALSRFRNIESADLRVDAPDVFFIGENGQGKTNILESIYFLSYGSSFRAASDVETIMAGFDETRIEGDYGKKEEAFFDRVEIRLSKERKTVEIDGKVIKDRRDLVHSHPCVVFSHDDMEFAVGAPERGRWFFDQTAALSHNGYIDTLRNYKRVLKMRNATLRNARLDVLAVLDEQLIEFGLVLMAEREKATKAFSSIFSEIYRHVSRLPYPVELHYQSSWKDRASAKSSLEEKRSVDIESGSTSCGPHRDRFIFKALGRNFSKSASTGQLRLLSLALRSCQAKYFFESSGQKPMLLMDDTLLELDPDRRRRFMESLPARVQTFSAFLPGEPFQAYMTRDTKVFKVEAGRYEEIPAKSSA
jgi:DNA replication and repair protein RecF